MTSIDWINTKAGIHAKAKATGLKAYNLGCDCYQCNKDFDEMMVDTYRDPARVPKDKLCIRDKRLLDNGKVRTNKLYAKKLSDNSLFISIKNGVTKEGAERRCTIMLDKTNQRLLKEWLNERN